MSSGSETGHAINLANFETIISYADGYGAAYNPSKPSLTLASLQLLFNDCETILATVKTDETTFNNATNDRKIAFNDMKSFVTKVVNALAVSGANAEVVKDAEAINKKIQGKRAAGAAKPAALQTDVPVAKSISASQQSFDSLVDNFKKLLDLLLLEPLYVPNETELSTETLTTRQNMYKKSNSNVVNATTDWSNARISRDELMYNTTAALVPTALAVKKYVKSLYGASSPQYNQVAGVKFTMIKKK